MKLTELDSILISFTSTPLKSINESGEETILSRRIVLLNCLGSMKPKDGIQSINIYKLGIRLASDKFIDITAEEFILLRECIEQNVPGYFPVVQGQILDYLLSAELDN